MLWVLNSTVSERVILITKNKCQTGGYENDQNFKPVIFLQFWEGALGSFRLGKPER